MTEIQKIYVMYSSLKDLKLTHFTARIGTLSISIRVHAWVPSYSVANSPIFRRKPFYLNL